MKEKRSDITLVSSFLSSLSHAVWSGMNRPQFQSRWIWSKPDAQLCVCVCVCVIRFWLDLCKSTKCMHPHTHSLSPASASVCVCVWEGWRASDYTHLSQPPPSLPLVATIWDNKNMSSKCLEWKIRSCRGWGRLKRTSWWFMVFWDWKTSPEPKIPSTPSAHWAPGFRRMSGSAFICGIFFRMSKQCLKFSYFFSLVWILTPNVLNENSTKVHKWITVSPSPSITS